MPDQSIGPLTPDYVLRRAQSISGGLLLCPICKGCWLSCANRPKKDFAGECRPHAARSRDERSEKSGRRMAAEKILFSRRRYGDMISENRAIISELSVESGVRIPAKNPGVLFGP